MPIETFLLWPSHIVVTLINMTGLAAILALKLREIGVLL